jgi:hypothetical protein
MSIHLCHNPSLGFMTKVRACKVAGQKESPGATSCALGSAKEYEGMHSHTPKWIPISGVGVPMDFWIFRGRLQGSKPIGLKSYLYHWKSIETYMFKMGSHDPFGHLKHKLWPKERPGVKLTVWFPTTKSRNWPDFLVWRWLATYHWKALDKGYNFALDVITIGGFHKKLWGPIILWESQLWEFNGSPGTNAIRIWASWRGKKYTIRGKVVASPKSGSWWVLWVRDCLWFGLTPKVFQLCTNQLVVWFV